MQIDPTKLLEARLARAMSQEEAAIASDLSTRTIQRIEAGHAASLESTKALLTIFGVDIICDPVVTPSLAVRPTWQSLSRETARQLQVSANLWFDGLRVALAAILIVIAGAKPLAPQQTGLFVSNDNFFALGILKGMPTGSQEILGYWIMPLMLVSAGVVLISVARLRTFIADQRMKI